jgi:hypothetical protein
VDDPLRQALQLEQPFKVRIHWLDAGNGMFQPDYKAVLRGSIRDDDVVAYYNTSGTPTIGYVTRIMRQSDGMFVRKIPSRNNPLQIGASPEPVLSMMIICRFMLCP